MTSTNRMTDAQRMAQTLGVIIGAASCCEQVTEERVTTVAVKLKQLVSATAEDGPTRKPPMNSFLLGSKSAKLPPRAGESTLNKQRPL
jgi:hypothetical protein